MGRNIKVTGTKVGSDGSGYFRGDDGKYYYGNPQNGYLTETEQSRRAHAGSQAAPPARPYSGGGRSGGGGATTGIEYLLDAVGAAAIVAAVVAMYLIALIAAVVFVWPDYVGRLLSYYQRGQADLMVIMMSAVVIFLIGYFLWSAYKVVATKRMQSKRYIIVCAVAMAVPAVPVGLFIGSPTMFISYAFQGIVMSVLPAFVLCWVEHVATKEIRRDREWFVSKVARLIARVCPCHSTGMIVFGVFALLGGALCRALFEASGVIGEASENIVSNPMSIVVTGILFIIMGIIAKRKGA